MSNKSLFTIVAATLITTGLSQSSEAATALTFTTEAWSFPNGSYNYGWTFTLAQSETVGKLGVWDQAGNGLGEAHPVGIWNAGGSLVVSTTVPAGTLGSFVASGSGGSGFRFADVTTPVVLPAGSYTVAAYFPTGADEVAGGVAPGNLTTLPGLTYGQNRQGGAGGLAQPGSHIGGDGIAFFGGNFQTVPEPTTLGLLAIGGIAALRRRRSK